ncbi:MAG: adenosylcobalamin-dependent ribonucleoside-diphosphate reductase [Methanobacteriota archaeon]
MIPLTKNGRIVLERRYLNKDERGRVVETPEAMFRRVAKNVAEVELSYGPRSHARAMEEEFYRVMSRLEFLPNSPCLMNAGNPLQQLSACFVLPVEDSIERIFETVKLAAIIHKTGGGTGFSFSQIRPAGDVVQSTGGVASGPVSFMGVFDAATEAIKQGGRRRGANMGVLRVDHPDVATFAAAKRDPSAFRNFNLSVAATDGFMEAAAKGRSFALVNPATTKTVRRVDARKLFGEIAAHARNTGDPGMLFLDTIERANPTPHLGPMEATNPCGEVPLLPYESCNLGSIDVGRFVGDGRDRIDKAGLAAVVHTGVRFLDDVIDATRTPHPEIERVTKANRKIGLGIMGFADLLVNLRIPYASEEARTIAEDLMVFIAAEARKASEALARERGPFANYEGSRFDREGGAKVRNATTTTIAPTGTISMIAGASSGVEPLFAVAYVREVLEGSRLLEVDPQFERMAREGGFWKRTILREIVKKGTVVGVRGVPKEVQGLFATSHDIPPEAHVEMQAAFQRHTENAVSKTVNLPARARVEDVERIFRLAHARGCKGITVYRAGSRPTDVLSKKVSFDEFVRRSCDAACRLGSRSE